MGWLAGMPATPPLGATRTNTRPSTEKRTEPSPPVRLRAAPIPGNDQTPRYKGHPAHIGATGNNTSDCTK